MSVPALSVSKERIIDIIMENLKKISAYLDRNNCRFTTQANEDVTSKIIASADTIFKADSIRAEMALEIRNIVDLKDQFKLDLEDCIINNISFIINNLFQATIPALFPKGDKEYTSLFLSALTPYQARIIEQITEEVKQAFQAVREVSTTPSWIIETSNRFTNSLINRILNSIFHEVYVSKKGKYSDADFQNVMKALLNLFNMDSEKGKTTDTVKMIILREFKTTLNPMQTNNVSESINSQSPEAKQQGLIDKIFSWIFTYAKDCSLGVDDQSHYLLLKDFLPSAYKSIRGKEHPDAQLDQHKSQPMLPQNSIVTINPNYFSNDQKTDYVDESGAHNFELY